LGTTNHSSLLAAVAFNFVFLFVFNLFLEGPSFYDAGEIFPTHLRAKGMTINVAAFGVINVLWLELEPTGQSKHQLGILQRLLT
jgi:predicted outer membrane lipoprotein